MFCPECGAKQPEENAKYCLKCGAALTRDKGSDAAKATDQGKVLEQQAAPHTGPSNNAPSHQKSEQSNAPDSQAPTEFKLPKEGANAKRIAIIAGIVVVVVAIVAIVVALMPKESPVPSSEPPAPQPQDSSSQNDDRPDYESFLGSWVAQDSEDETMPKEWFEKKAKEGIYIVLTLEEQGKGTFQMEEGTTDITWEADSVSQATVTVGANKVQLEMQGAKALVMKNADGKKMFFVDADDVDMSNAAKPGNTGSNSDTSSQKPAEGMQVIGNKEVGFMQVPTSWTDRSSDLDPNFVKSNHAVYYVDPSSEFTSGVSGKFAFSRSYKISVEDSSYKAVVSRVAAQYQGEGYGETSEESGEFAGHKGVLIASSVPKDNLAIMTIVIDRDGDEKRAVVFEVNCGSMGNTKDAEELLSYLKTWAVN